MSGLSRSMAIPAGPPWGAWSHPTFRVPNAMNLWITTFFLAIFRGWREWLKLQEARFETALRLYIDELEPKGKVSTCNLMIWVLRNYGFSQCWTPMTLLHWHAQSVQIQLCSGHISLSPEVIWLQIFLVLWFHRQISILLNEFTMFHIPKQFSSVKPCKTQIQQFKVFFTSCSPWFDDSWWP